MVDLVSWQTTLAGWWQRLRTSDFVQKVAETFGTRLLLIAIGLVTGVIVTRTLGPEGRGLYATAVAVGAIGVQFGNLGLHASNTYYVAQDRSRLATLVGNSLAVSLGIGGAVVALAGLLFVVWPQIAPLHGLLLALALLWIPLGLAYLLLQNLLMGIQEVRAYNLVELSVRLLMVAGVGLVIWSGVITPEWIFVASLVSVAVGLVLVGRQLMRQIQTRLTLSTVLFRQGLRYGFKAYLAAFFAYLVLRADLLMVSHLLGAEQAGYYAIAAGMADLLFLLPTVLGTVIFPRLTALGERQAQYRLARKATGMSAVALLGIIVAAAFVAEPAIRLLYGAAFVPATYAFLWLLPGIFFLGVETVSVQFLNSIGLPPVVVAAWVISALLNIALNLWAIPLYGISGAAGVSSLSYGMMCLMVLLIIQRWK